MINYGILLIIILSYAVLNWVYTYVDRTPQNVALFF